MARIMKKVNVITTKRVSTLDTTLLKIYLLICVAPCQLMNIVNIIRLFFASALSEEEPALPHTEGCELRVRKRRRTVRARTS